MENYLSPLAKLTCSITTLLSRKQVKFTDYIFFVLFLPLILMLFLFYTVPNFTNSTFIIIIAFLWIVASVSFPRFY